MLSQRDHTEPILSRDLARAVWYARARGYRAIRTSALLDRSAATAERAGFELLDSLELLRRDLSDPLVPPWAPDESPPSISRLRWWHHGEAARVDRAAFGPMWGMDRRSIAMIRRATPRHWARRVNAPGSMIGFVIAGLGQPRAATGYIQRLSVHPDHHGRGIGRSLVFRALTALLDAGVGTAIVNTGADNHRAMALYTAAGFSPTGQQMTVWEFTIGSSQTHARP